MAKVAQILVIIQIGLPKMPVSILVNIPTPSKLRQKMPEQYFLGLTTKAMERKSQQIAHGIKDLGVWIQKARII